MPPKRSTSAGKAKAAKVAKVEEAAPDAAVETKSAGSSKKAATAPAGTYVEQSETPRKVRDAAGLVIVHWNVGGLNGLLKNEARVAKLKELIQEEAPHLLAFSEHKISEDKVEAATKALQELLPAYTTAHWAVCTAKKGYSGVVVLVKEGTEVKNVELDAICDLNEGRTVTLELESCHVVATYVPNAGFPDLKRLQYRIDEWEPAMAAHMSKLAKLKPLVVVGDLNVAHLDADIWNVSAKHIHKSPGTTPQERKAFTELLESGGWVDAFRKLYPEASGCFSYWSTRSGNQHLNRGLRLDYALLSPEIAEITPGAPLSLYDCSMMKEYVPNGDHAPTLVSFTSP